MSEVRAAIQKHINHVGEYNTCLDKLSKARETVNVSMAEVADAIQEHSPGNEPDYLIVGETCLMLDWLGGSLKGISAVENNLLIEGKVMRV